MMFYKHWKKIALALTGLFWASCEDSVSSEACLYGTPDYITNETEDVDGASSSSAKAASSAALSSSEKASSAESAKSSSSKQKESSSSSKRPGPLGIVSCYDVSSDRQTLVRQQNNGTTLLSCDDGTACQEKVIEADATAPDCEATDCDGWEPPIVRDTVYYCINGENTEIYTSEEFKERYAKVEEEVEEDIVSSSSDLDMPVTYYGPACYFDDSCEDE